MANFVPLWHDDEPAVLLFDVKRQEQTISASCYAFMKPLEKGSRLDDEGVTYTCPLDVLEEQTADLKVADITLWQE